MSRYRLGHKKLNNGYRKLDEVIRGGSCSKQNRKNLPAALGLPPEVQKGAFEKTDRQIREGSAEAGRSSAGGTG